MPEYISREAAISAIIGAHPDAHYPDWYAAILAKLPAADVAPVVHGRWDISKGPLGDMCKCSACGSLPSLPTKFCPYCGARMDGATE